MLLISTISEASFRHVQGVTARDLWLALEKAYAPHTSSREYTLKTQLLKISMHGDESVEAYLNRAQEYADALAAIGEPVKDKDLVMLTIAGLREEYNGLKTTITARQFATTFSELQGLLSDHDFMLGKTRAAGPTTQVFHTTATISTPPGFSPTPQEPSSSTKVNQNASLIAHQQLVAQASALGFQLVPYTNNQAFFGFRQSNKSGGRGNYRGGFSNTRRNFSNSRGNLPGNRSDSRFSWATTQNTVFGSCTQCGIRHLPSQCVHNQNNCPPARDNHNQQSANYASYRPDLINSTSWFPDTGANSHVTPDLASLDAASTYTGYDSLGVGNGQTYPQYPPHGPQ